MSRGLGNRERKEISREENKGGERGREKVVKRVLAWSQGQLAQAGAQPE